MNDENSTPPQPAQAGPRWQPLSLVDRRVAGVLVEKAKTTPDAYPMSLGAICNACNQKSNRSPVMKLEPEDVEESLQRLRELGAVGMIEGYGRVAKYRHYLYEWLGVDKVELAVMAELLLRGPQTEGELRARATRMEPIRDLAALRPVLFGLKSRGLAVPLTAKGRGHVVTHGLHQPRELEGLKVQYAGRPATAPSSAPPSTVPPPIEDKPVAQAETAGQRLSPLPAAPPTAAAEVEVLDALRGQISELRAQMIQLQSNQDELIIQVRQVYDEVHRLSDALGG